MPRATSIGSRSLPYAPGCFRSKGMTLGSGSGAVRTASWTFDRSSSHERLRRGQPLEGLPAGPADVLVVRGSRAGLADYHEPAVLEEVVAGGARRDGLVAAGAGLVRVPLAQVKSGDRIGLHREDSFP